MAKLPDRRDIELAYEIASRKRHFGYGELDDYEKGLLERADRKVPLVEGPWVLDLMDPNEEHLVRPATGMCYSGTKRIAWKPGMSDEDSAHIFRHELGHARYTKPWSEDYILGIPGDDPKGEKLVKLLNELMADYYSLTVVSDDAQAKRYIEDNKQDAYHSGGLWKSDIDKIDKLARERVGYTGREVSWRP